MIEGDELDRAIGEIARRLAAQGRIGEENRKLSRRDELRFGTNGSLAVIIAGSKCGTWYDHENQVGGGYWKLIEEKGGIGDVYSWLEREGFAREADYKRKREARHHWGNGSANQPGGSLGDIRKTYDYVDEQGLLLFQVVRYDNHQFRQRRPDDKGGWIWQLGDTRRVLYRLPQVLAAKASRNGHPWRVFLCEGEKDADRLRDQWGVTATTNPGGAGNWLPEFDSLFAGSETILFEDNDEPGRKRTAKLAPALVQAGAIVKVIGFPHLDEGGDISDWLDDGASQSDLETLIENIEPYASAAAWIDPKTLTLDYWLERDIPLSDFLLGELFSTNTRALLVAPSGLGKTNIALAIAISIAAGCDFLHWRCHRPARVLYIDAEMPRRLTKKRLGDAVRRQSRTPNLFILHHEDLPEPLLLDTPTGQQTVDAVIKLLGGVDFVIFDNIQALMAPGDDFGAMSWHKTLPWVRSLSRRLIGQLWVHHTGHNKDHGYGTSTREWQLDLVMLLEAIERANTDIAFTLKFTKARERTPDNRTDFAEAVITLAKDQWSWESSGRSGSTGGSRGRPPKVEDIALRALDEALAQTGQVPQNHPKITPETYCVTVDMWQRYFEQVHIGDAKPESVGRVFRKYAAKLQAAGAIAVAHPWVWRTRA